MNYKIKILRYTLFLFCCAIPLINLQGVEKVIDVKSSVHAPDRHSDKWSAYLHFELGCGIRASTYIEFAHQSSAEDEVAFNLITFLNEEVYLDTAMQAYQIYDKKIYLPTYTLNFLKYNQGYFVGLYLSDLSIATRTPKLISVSENKITGWFSDSYSYILELSDGSLWQTKERNSPWKQPWKAGSPILNLGSNEKPCLINLEGSLNHQLNYIEIEDGLNYFFSEYHRIN